MKVQGFALLPLVALWACGSNTSNGPATTHDQSFARTPSAGSSSAAGTVAVPTAGSTIGPIAGSREPTSGNPAVVAVSGGAGVGLPMPAAAGSISAPVSMVAAGSGGMMGTTVAGAGAAGGGANAPTTYPMLDAAMIGAPVNLKLSVTPTLSLAEGPLWDPCKHQLLFVDVNASNIYQMDANNKVSVLASNTNKANGIAFDLDGSLIMVQMGVGQGQGHLARRDKSGMIKTIEPSGGPMLHTPDDVIVRSDGTIYFTDFGALTAAPVYELPPMGTKLINGGTALGSNGIELSPDEKTLYVDGYSEGSVWKFAVAPDGMLTKGVALATGLANPDSLCLDAAGNLYVGVSSGLQVLRPDGSKVAVIPAASAQGTTNCTFGGDDGKTLYITAWTSVFKVEKMPIPGLDWVVNRKRLSCM